MYKYNVGQRHTKVYLYLSLVSNCVEYVYLFKGGYVKRVNRLGVGIELYICSTLHRSDNC